MAARLARREHVAVVGAFQAWVRGPIRVLLQQRLRRVLIRRGLAPGDAANRPADRLADAAARSFAAEIVAATPRLTAAARDPRPGVTLAFAFTYASRAALVTDAAPPKPTFRVSPGWQRG